MNEIVNYVYHTSLIFTFLLCGRRWYQGDKQAAILTFAFLAAILAEALAKSVQYSLLGDAVKFRRLLYHLYIPLEYCFFAYYFYSISQSTPIKKGIVLSVILFAPICIILSQAQLDNMVLPLTKKDPFPLPTLIYNIEGVLLIILSILVLFTSWHKPGKRLSGNLYYWICLGLLIYHSGSYLLNIFYDEIENKQSSLAIGINTLINNGLNIIMYTIFSVGLIYAKNDSE